MIARGPVLLLLPVVLALAAVLVTLKSFEPPPEPDATAPERPTPRYELGNAEWTRFNVQGEPELRATAARIEYFDDQSAHLTTLRLDRLGGTAGPWQIEAPAGVVPPNQTRIQVGEPVRVTGQWQDGDAVEIAARRLWVDWQRREIYTDDRVRMTSKRRNARAHGLRANWAGTRVQLLRRVEVEYDAPR